MTTQDGRKIGEVDELIVDTEATKVRYIAVDLDEDAAGSDRKVLVSIGAAQLDDDDRVLVIGISAEQFATLPEYRRESFDRGYESTLHSSYDRDRTADRDRADDRASEDVSAARHFDD